MKDKKLNAMKARMETFLELSKAKKGSGEPFFNTDWLIEKVLRMDPKLAKKIMNREEKLKRILNDNRGNNK